MGRAVARWMPHPGVGGVGSEVGPAQDAARRFSC